MGFLTDAIKKNRANATPDMEADPFNLFGTTEKEIKVMVFPKPRAARKYYQSKIVPLAPKYFGKFKDVKRPPQGTFLLNTLGEVNNIVNNSLRYFTHTEDKWIDANNAFKIGAGDCEEFALCKMAALEFLGADPNKMRIVVGPGHAVLACWMPSTIMILDNEVKNVYDHRSAHGHRLWGFATHSFNKTRWWVHTTIR